MIDKEKPSEFSENAQQLGKRGGKRRSGTMPADEQVALTSKVELGSAVACSSNATESLPPRTASGLSIAADIEAEIEAFKNGRLDPAGAKALLKLHQKQIREIGEQIKRDRAAFRDARRGKAK